MVGTSNQSDPEIPIEMMTMEIYGIFMQGGAGFVSCENATR